jgi:starch synthase
MDVLFAAVEMSPLAKVGGLGDVAGSLPRALIERGVNVRVALPMHSAIDRTLLAPRKVLDNVKVGRSTIQRLPLKPSDTPWPSVQRGETPGEQRVNVWMSESRGVPVYLIENARYFDRTGVYGFDDDKERFLFFCDALLAAAPHLGFRPDVIHAQDWHTALLLTRLAGMDAAGDDHPWIDAGRVYTIHNLALQGTFDAAFADDFRIAPGLLAAPQGLAAAITYSAMAQGILHADRVNTVSETYAKEIMTPEYGAGLDPLLQARASVVSGIVNGIDYEEFNPATDPHIVRHYSADTLDDRIANKRALQQTAGLPQNDRALLFGVVTRLFAQKGIDLVAVAFDRMLQVPRRENQSPPQRASVREMQLAVLGTGDEDVHRMLLQLQEKYPQKVKIWLDFNPALGQQIYAGCDSFLMPSRYEPCGLGQLISLRYGAVPLVRKTGGLADTVQNADLPLRSGNGFVFEAANATELQYAAERALASFENEAGWRALQERGMRQDWSWNRAAGKYIKLYEAARAARLAATTAVT